MALHLPLNCSNCRHVHADGDWCDLPVAIVETLGGYRLQYLPFAASVVCDQHELPPEDSDDTDETSYGHGV